MPSETIEKLIKARDTIRKGWTQHEIAATKDGISVDFDDPRATHYCLIGALQLAGIDTDPDTNEILYPLAEAIFGSMTNWSMNPRVLTVNEIADVFGDHFPPLDLTNMDFIEEVYKEDQTDPSFIPGDFHDTEMFVPSHILSKIDPSYEPEWDNKTFLGLTFNTACCFMSEAEVCAHFNDYEETCREEVLIVLGNLINNLLDKEEHSHAD